MLDAAPNPPAQTAPDAAWRGSQAKRRPTARQAEGVVWSALGTLTWIGGLWFTAELTAPIVGASFAWLAAIGVQLVLSGAQFLSRRRRMGGAGWLAVALDIGINYAGIAVGFGLIAAPSEAVAHIIAVASAPSAGSANALIALAVAVLIAWLPENFARLAYECIAPRKGRYDA